MQKLKTLKSHFNFNPKSEVFNIRLGLQKHCLYPKSVLSLTPTEFDEFFRAIVFPAKNTISEFTII